MQNTQFIKDNIGENLDDLRHDNDLLDTTPKAQSMKEIIDKLDFINIKNFCSGSSRRGIVVNESD